MLKLGRYLLFCAGTLVAAAAPASGLRVEPLRIDLSKTQSSGQVELGNFTAQPMPVQVTAMRWTQKDGVDVYEPTKDIFFAPPIITVPGDGKTVVRFRLRGKAPANTEGAYRIYLQEVTPPQSGNNNAMTFRLRLGVPLFVQADRPTPPKLAVQSSVADQRLKLAMENSGGTHLKILGLSLVPADIDREQPGGVAVAQATHSDAQTNYLLAGTTHHWSMEVPEGVDLSKHLLMVRTDDYSASRDSGIDERGWMWVELGSPKTATP